jgi:hypothetical protein
VDEWLGDCRFPAIPALKKCPNQDSRIYRIFFGFFLVKKSYNPKILES